MEPLLEGLLRSLGGSEANFLELCFGRFPYGNFHTKATSKKFRPPSGNFRPNPPELPRSPSMSFSSRKAGWRNVLKGAQRETSNPQTVENKGESDHFLEIPENLEILEILQIPPVKRPPFVMTPFSGPEKRQFRDNFWDNLVDAFAC